MHNRVSIQVRMSYPGGGSVVELTRFNPGAIPNAFIVDEPEDVSPGRTLVRDQVQLINALRQLGNPRSLTAVMDADSRCKELFAAAQALMDAPDPNAVRQGAAA